MAAIYQPTGAAREYSPLALNYIKGCDHGCVYCYVPKMMKRFDKDYIHSNVYIKEESKLLKEVTASAKKNAKMEKPVKLTTLGRFKLTRVGRTKLTTLGRGKLTT